MEALHHEQMQTHNKRDVKTCGKPMYGTFCTGAGANNALFRDPESTACYCALFRKPTFDVEGWRGRSPREKETHDMSAHVLRLLLIGSA